MNGNLKKITGWSLLLLAAAPLLLITGFFIKQQHLQHEMEERMERSALHTIHASVQNIVWVKPGKEVEVGGRLFDVKSFTISGNTITLTGLYDHEEQVLKSDLLKLFSDKKNSTTPLSHLVLKFFTITAVHDYYSVIPQVTETAVSNKFIVYADALASRVRAVVTPPPNI